MRGAGPAPEWTQDLQQSLGPLHLTITAAQLEIQTPKFQLGTGEGANPLQVGASFAGQGQGRLR